MSKVIHALQALVLNDMPGVRVFPLHGSDARRGVPQDVLVVVDPNGKIPLHSHETDAHMTITGGSAIVHSTDIPDGDGVEVGPGTCVFFAAFKNHGFTAGKDGLSFISRNGGIVDQKGNWDIAFA